MLKTIKTLKNFGVLCAIESVVAFTFLVTAGMCLHAGAVDGVVVSLLVAGGTVGLGMLRYRTLTAAPAETGTPCYAQPDLPVKPKRNRPKPAPVKPRKVVKKGKARPKK